MLNTARKKCLKKGADLAMPRTQSVLEKLWSVYDGHSWGRSKALLGALDSLYLEWKWSDGSQVNPSVWGPGEPYIQYGSVLQQNGKCGVMANLADNIFTRRTWSTACGWWLVVKHVCNKERGFICETSPGNTYKQK